MKLIVRTEHHGDYTIEKLPDADALDVAEDFRDPEGAATMTFEMDEATVIIDRARIVAIELEPDVGGE